MIEWAKKHWILLVAGLGGVFILYYFYKSSSTTATPTSSVPPDPNPGYDYWNGSTWVPYSQANTLGIGSTGVDTTGGGASLTQPATSSSGVSSASPTITPYVSPVNATTTPSIESAAAATANPFSTNPNPSSGPDYSQNQIAGAYAFSPNPVTALQVAMGASPSTTPGGGSDTAQTALQNALNTAAQPGGLAVVQYANPYLNSSYYTQAQAALLQKNCAADPNSPGCQVSIATGEIATGSPTVASEVYNTSVYCEGNAFDAVAFGMPGDSVNCSGSQPTKTGVAAVISQVTGPGTTAPAPTGFNPATQSWAQYVASQSGVNFGASVGTPSVTTPAPAQPSPVGTGGGFSGPGSASNPFGPSGKNTTRAGLNYFSSSPDQPFNPVNTNEPIESGL